MKSRGRLGPGVNDDKSIRILNRVITLTDAGIEYEADQRHAELIVKGTGLEGESKVVKTPGIK